MNHQIGPLSPGLYFVGVPIGSARDITLRALDVLASAEILAAEDTRSLRKLMDIHGIPLGGRRIQALHDHSKGAAVDRLVRQIGEGHSVAYASEAGMPLIADPGFELAQAVVAADLPVTCAPGPSAVLTALCLAGLPTDAFFFAGFLPSATVARCRSLEALREIPGTLVFYESPRRLAAMLKDAVATLGAERHAAVCRELTKKFEETQRGTLNELTDHYRERQVKGEVVVLIDRARLPSVSEDDITSDLEKALETATMRDAVDLVASAHNVPRKQVYKMALDLKKKPT